ncbi:hypothetical protein B2G71_15710 [Novosphingobium sp. PC22D]|uniref:hypothetical protein n=1 Tax=Novosphingobium sp. PC22D TaxID=1962403 RepID=UPI000BF23A55|nr:hypothetical protein [Novosphingobium sp. PC22D]PEQ11575.1 hypothetical protein B2G71_15710 [Novosphingobium sp. PC22D]
MTAGSGNRVLFSLAIAVVVLVVVAIAIGTEEREGPLLTSVRSATNGSGVVSTRAGASDAAPAAARDTGPAIEATPEERDGTQVEFAEDDFLIDDASGVDPTADVPPEPMVNPSGTLPEPSGPDAVVALESAP